MKIVILGTGTPQNRSGSSVLINMGEDNLLFDCGRWITLKLSEAGFVPDQVTHLFFTHIFHWDHTCNYYDFLMSHRLGRLRVYGPTGTKEFTEGLLELHNKYGEGRTRPILEWIRENTFNVSKGTFCSGSDWKVFGVDIDVNTRWRPNIVYRIEHKGFSIVVAWDIHPRHDLYERRGPFWEHDDTFTSREELMKLLEGSDLAIVDVMKGHTTPEGVGIAAEKAGVKKLILTHYGREDQSDTIEQIKKIYGGQVILGRDLMTLCF